MLKCYPYVCVKSVTEVLHMFCFNLWGNRFLIKIQNKCWQWVSVHTTELWYKLYSFNEYTRNTSKIHLLMIWPLHKLLFICLYNIFFKSHVTFMSLLMVLHYFESCCPWKLIISWMMPVLRACNKSATLISQKLSSIFSSELFDVVS